MQSFGSDSRPRRLKRNLAVGAKQPALSIVRLCLKTMQTSMLYLLCEDDINLALSAGVGKDEHLARMRQLAYTVCCLVWAQQLFL